MIDLGAMLGANVSGRIGRKVKMSKKSKFRKCQNFEIVDMPKIVDMSKVSMFRKCRSFEIVKASKLSNPIKPFASDSSRP